MSMSKAADNGKVTEFDEDSCKLDNSANPNVSRSTKFGSLYYLDCRADLQANVVQPEPELKDSVAQALWTSWYARSSETDSR